MPVRPNQKALEARERLSGLAAHHLNLKDQAKELDVSVVASTTKIKETFAEAGPEANGKHSEVHLLLPDGVTRVLVQLQTKESVSMRPNLLALLRQRLGAEAEPYIVKQEVLVPNALEQLVTQGKLSRDDLDLLLETKTSKSLIVKEEK